MQMVVHLHKTGNEFTFVLPPQVVQELELADGSAIEIAKVASEPVRTIRYATVEEVMEAHRLTLPNHEHAYRELAK